MRRRYVFLDLAFVLKKAGDAVRATCPGMPRSHCHLIRKTRAMDLSQAGVPLPLVAQLLGHESVSTTSGFYALATDGIMAEAVRAAAPISLSSRQHTLARPEPQTLYWLEKGGWQAVKRASVPGVCTCGGTIPEAETRASSPEVGSARERLLDEATTDEARRIVKELYRPNAETGDGGTADAIREQLRTGEMVGGKDHIRKGRERPRQIEKILTINPDHPDRALLERLRDDLEDALGGA